MKHVFQTLIILLFTNFLAFSQPRMSKVQISIVPDRSDAMYHAGENAQVKISVLECGMELTGTTINYEVSEDLMPPHISKSITLTGNETAINIGSMKKPGFLRIKASLTHDGTKYTSMATVGFDAHLIKPTVILPDGFTGFWKKQVEAARKTALKPMMTLLPERCTDKVNVYHISYGNIGGSKMYGILTMPSAEGKYPAILRFPGAGVGEKGGDIAHAEQGVIVLELGIHGIPVNLDGDVYADLNRGALASYPTYNIDNKYSYFYKRVYVGCVRGVDFLLWLPQCNGRIGTLGGSQGGALSIAVSALDNRIKATAAYFPALSDMEGYMHNRAGGWPHILKNEKNRTPEIIETARFYDTANFARLLKSPVFYAYGYNDLACAPTTTCAVFNSITAPKQVSIGENTGHWLYPEQTAQMWNWIISELNKQ